jgi:hypothetical protein
MQQRLDMVLRVFFCDNGSVEIVIIEAGFLVQIEGGTKVSMQGWFSVCVVLL